MILRVNKHRLITYMFYCLLLSSTIGYTGYYMYTFSQGIDVYNNFSDISIDGFYTYLFASSIKFLKDIIFVCLFILCMVDQDSNVKKMNIVFCLFIAYGSIIAFLEGYSESILGGIRGYLYFFVLLYFFYKIKSCNISLDTIRKIIYFALITNFVVIMEQAYRGTNGLIFLAGTGGYRFTGLFGGFAPCSAFAVSVCLLFFVYSCYFTFSKVKSFFIVIATLLIECMCGSRSGMICVILIGYIWMFKLINVKSIYKYFFMLSSLGLVVAVVIKFVESIANRGSILEVQMESGRLKIFYDVINGLFQNIFALVFGHGLGAGSNTSVLMGRAGYAMESAPILDGTFNTILYQFGVLGVIAIVSILLFLWLKLKNVPFDLKMAFYLIVFIEGITGNIFENYAFLIIFFLTYRLMCNPHNFYAVRG